ncbi:MAG: LytTR family DNA-binding domain-containing protein [Anaerovoracaceae bacterium]|nr:LytTR family DNA-binding domain-containing protein [Anaerovoracaceae bacterium]
MKISVEISKNYDPPYAVIYTAAVTDEIRKIIDDFETGGAPIIAQADERYMVLKPEDVYMVRVENGTTVIYTKKKTFVSRKRLYELQEQLGGGFMRIAKSCIINLSYIVSVEAGFGGTLLLKLSNGESDYVSRKYLPGLKRYLGL